ncbi:hypothetical protein GH714_034475 [Hevea brasiliensis]|uniref:Uncharacterized protein n=1 Tax=Hevea brasiliensis TaxID=3981 RepID=A0A6A6L352_HEVBR|nr:hypothetical protein GH714_034475 [Hevea brasiliensis]
MTTSVSIYSRLTSCSTSRFNTQHPQAQCSVLTGYFEMSYYASSDAASATQTSDSCKDTPFVSQPTEGVLIPSSNNTSLDNPVTPNNPTQTQLAVAKTNPPIAFLQLANQERKGS